MQSFSSSSASRVWPAFKSLNIQVHRSTLGLALIVSGIVALLISIWQYRWTVHYLWSADFLPIAGMRAGATTEKMQSPVLAVAILLVCIGLFAFFAVLLRLV